MLRRLTVLLALSVIVVVSAAPTRAETFYVSQFGGTVTGGVLCNGHLAISAAAFNLPSNWANPKVAGKIGPGDTTIACGTFTGSAGGTMLFFQASGNSGNVIVLLFDTATTFSAPFWLNGGSGNGGAINTNGKSHLLVNGGTTCGWNPSTRVKTACNGTIQNTANGTLLANQAAYQFITISGSSTDIEIENLNFLNGYVRVGTGTDYQPVSNAGNDIGISNSATQIKIHNSVMSAGNWSILGGGDNLFVYNNDFGGYDHNVSTFAVHFYVYSNHFHDWAVWDSTNNFAHHDGIHCFKASVPGVTLLADIYGNQFDGTTGANMNQFIFLEGNTSGTPCMATGGVTHQFNNIMLKDSSFPTALSTSGPAGGSDNGDVFANNTVLGFSTSDSTSTLGIQNAIATKVENNALGNTGFLVNASGTQTYSVFDFNAYQGCTTFNCFTAAGVNTGSPTAWQAGSCTGSANTCDPHGLFSSGFPLSSTTYFQLNSACVVGSVGASCVPTATSPLIAKGANLTSICSGQPVPGLGALCNDAAGNLRPTVGSWDIGAYQFTSTTIPPSPPTGLSASVAGSTVSLSWTASTGTPVPTAYTLYRSTVHGGPYSIVKSGITSLSTTDTPANGSYFYTVTAFVGGLVTSISGNGSTATVTCSAVCAFPSGTAFTIGGDSTTAFNGTFTSTGQPTSTTFTFASATNGTGTGGGAWSTSQESAKSNEVAATVPAALSITLLPASRTFASFTVGTPSPSQSATYTNTSGPGQSTTISSKSFTGPNAGDFSETDNCPATVTSSSSCTFNITFQPTAPGLRTANLTVVDNATGSPHTVAVSGTGVAAAPGVSLSPASLDFGQQTLSTTSTARSIILTNTGTGTLTISSVVASGDFAVTTVPITNCGSTLAPLATCSLNVTFTPTATGGRSGAVTVTDNASGSPHVASLTGTGITTKCAMTGNVALSGTAGVCQ